VGIALFLEAREYVDQERVTPIPNHASRYHDPIAHSLSGSGVETENNLLAGEAIISWAGAQRSLPDLFRLLAAGEVGLLCPVSLCLLDNCYTRVNFDLPDESWTLDSMKHLSSLFYKDCTAAHDQLALLLDRLSAARQLQGHWSAMDKEVDQNGTTRRRGAPVERTT